MGASSSVAKGGKRNEDKAQPGKGARENRGREGEKKMGITAGSIMPDVHFADITPLRSWIAFYCAAIVGAAPIDSC